MASNAAMGMHTSGGTGSQGGRTTETDTDNGKAEVMDPLERASRAILDVASVDRDGFIENGREIACAVLIAIREPSEFMLEGFGIDKARMKQNWGAMIDAALNERSK